MLKGIQHPLEGAVFFIWKIGAELAESPYAVSFNALLGAIALAEVIAAITAFSVIQLLVANTATRTKYSSRFGENISAAETFRRKYKAEKSVQR